MKQKPIKETLSNFKPDPIVFVISVDTENKPSGMVAAWHMRCSSDPPLYAISLSKKGNTQKLIRGSKEFVVAVPNAEMEVAVMVFGTRHGHELDKFAESKLETVPAKVIRTPLIKDATFNFECKLIKKIDAGDHYIFIGSVVAAYQKGKKVLMSLGKVDGKRSFQSF